MRELAHFGACLLLKLPCGQRNLTLLNKLIVNWYLLALFSFYLCNRIIVFITVVLDNSI